MAKYDKKEFSALCGLETKNLAVYIKRKKVNVVAEMIDDKDPINAKFIEDQKARLRKTASPKPVKEPKQVKVAKDKPENTEDDAEDDENPYAQAVQHKLSLDVAKRQNEIDLQKIEIQKKRGELVPVEAIRSLLVVHSESIKTAYVDAAEDLLVRISQRKQLTTVETAELRKELAETVNKAIDDAISASKKTLLGVTQDFMRKRGVGQHD